MIGQIERLMGLGPAAVAPGQPSVDPDELDVFCTRATAAA